MHLLFTPESIEFFFFLSHLKIKSCKHNDKKFESVHYANPCVNRMLKIILIAFDHQKIFPIISFKREEIEKKGEREREREREREVK